MPLISPREVKMNTSKALEGAARGAIRNGTTVLSVSFFLSFVVNILRLAGPLFMILIYDRVLSSRSEETLVALFVMVAVFMLVLGMADYARKRIVARFAAQFQEKVETTLLASTPQNEMFLRGGAKPAAGIDEIDGLRGFIHSGGLIAIMDFIWVPMFVTVIFILHPVLGWVTLGGVGVMLALVLTQMIFIGNRKEEARIASNRIGELKNMLIASRDVVRTQEMGGGFKRRWLDTRDNARDKAIALKDWTSWFDSMSSTTVMLARYTVLACGAYMTLQGELTVGAMVAATFLVTRVLSPVDRFMVTIPKIREATVHWKKLKEVLTSRASHMTDNYAEELGNPRVRLQLDNVSVRSPLTNVLLLKSVSLSVQPGEMIEITSEPSGGKSVLAETILGMWKRSSGSIYMDGRHINRLADRETTTKFGFVPEHPHFFVGTIEENISRMDDDATPEKVASAARRAKLHALISALPDGYATKMDVRGTGFSSGQKYQLALARAIYHNPTLLIIDNPDPLLFERIPKKMEITLGGLLQRGGSIVVFARKPIQFSLVSRFLALKGGKLVERRASVPKSVSSDNKVTVLDGTKKSASNMTKAARR